jgi:hypothetical protein
MRLVPRLFVAAIAGPIVSLVAACGTNATPPASPVRPEPSASGLSGTWSGSGTDPQGAEKMSWQLSQSGAALSGTADLAPLNAADGSCASCHKFKTGTIAGSVSGSTLTIRLTFPSGGDGVPTPMCTIVFDASALVDGNRISATYTGDDSCEGPFTGGSFVMSR